MDPIKSGKNWYVYCSNNPLKFVDKTGLYTQYHTNKPPTFPSNGMKMDYSNDPSKRPTEYNYNEFIENHIISYWEAI